MLRLIPTVLRAVRCQSTATESASTEPATIPDPNCDPKNPQKLTFTQVSTAYYGIKDGVHHSACRHSRHLSRSFGADVFLKMELNQITGSFKERGARWALLNLDDKFKKIGVFAASAGNHALALSYHGKQLGIPVTVVMPRHAPIMKIDMCRKLGATIHVEGKDISASRKSALQFAKEKGGLYINGYDHVDILAGAGTIGLEILDQVKGMDAVLVPIGGGGLIAGVSTVIKSLMPKIQVIGVESNTCPSFKVALKNGSPVATTCEPTLADGLAVPTVGVNAFVNNVDRVVEVSDRQIALAILRLVEWEKVVTEGAGAIGIGALLSGQLDDLKGKRIVSILTGGNIDSTVLGAAVERGMVYDNRLMRTRVVVSDRPGGLKELTEIIANAGGSVKQLHQERAWTRPDVFSVSVNMMIEARSAEHSQEIADKLLERYTNKDVKLLNEELPEHTFPKRS